MELTVKLILALLASMGVGVSVVGLPGAIMVLLCLLAYGAFTDFVTLSWTTIFIFSFFTVLTIFVDDLAMLVGVKTFGASKYGVWGAVIGGIIGMILFFPVGTLPGAFIGTLIMEFQHDPDLQKAVKKGFGTLLGYVAGLVLKFLITLVLFIWFLLILF